MNRSEFFERLSSLILALRGRNFTTEADALYNAMTISTVPGEILGELRLLLHEMEEKGIASRAHLETEFSDLLRYLDQILS